MFYNILKSALEIAPKKDVRYYLNGVRILREEGSNVIVYATDGHCAFKASLSSEFSESIPEGTDLILERECLMNALKMFKKNTKLPLTIVDNCATLNGLTLNNVDGKFPDVERILNPLNDKRNPADAVGVGFEVLEKVTKAGKIAFPDKRKQFATMRIGDASQIISLSANCDDFDLLIVFMPSRV